MRVCALRYNPYMTGHRREAVPINSGKNLSMFDPIHASPERARVRVRDLVAAWALVALVLGASALPIALEAAKAEAIEDASILHAVPKLLHRNHQA